MENQIIKCLLLKNGDLLISEIAEVDTELPRSSDISKIHEDQEDDPLSYFAKLAES